MEPQSKPESFRDEVNRHEVSNDLMELKLVVYKNMFENLDITFGEGYSPDAMFTITEFINYNFLNIRNLVDRSVSAFNASQLASYESPTVKMNVEVGDLTEDAEEGKLPLRIEMGFVADTFLIEYDNDYKEMVELVVPVIKEAVGDVLEDMVPLCVENFLFMSNNLPAPDLDEQ